MEEVYGEHAQMRVRVVIATVPLLLPSAALAQVEKRIALLIGNRAYDTSVAALKNPHNTSRSSARRFQSKPLRCCRPSRMRDEVRSWAGYVEAETKLAALEKADQDRKAALELLRQGDEAAARREAMAAEALRKGQEEFQSS